MDELVDALNDRTITDEQMALLNRMLESDADARTKFMNLMRIEAELGAMHMPLEQMTPDRTQQPDQPAARLDAAQAVSPAGPAPKQSRPSLRISRSIVALAASIALAMACSSWLTLEGTRGRGPLASLLATEAGEPVGAVARIAATRNCRWRGERVDIGYGAELEGGQLLELETGVAELTFSGGARLVLEGPAAFRIPDHETIELYVGRVAAAVPKEAGRFSVRTPRLVVSDCGAQFGVVAEAGGRDEVHVFEGPVRAHSLDRQGRATGAVSLANLQAARLRSADDGFTLLSADDHGFVRSLSTRSGPGDGLLAFDNFAYPSGPLAWQNGGFGWAGPWADIEASDDPTGVVASTNGVARGSLSTADMVSLGNRLLQTGNGNRVRRALSTSLGGVFDAAGLVENADGLPLIGRDGTTLYISFLQRASKTDDVFYGFELHRGDGNFNRVLCVGNGAEGHGYGVSSNYAAQERVRFAPLGEENTEANFIVLRIDFGEDGEDRATIYRNPRSMSHESDCDVSASMNGVFAFDRVSLGNFKGSKLHEIDEIRIGTDFAAVTGSPTAANPGVATKQLPLLRASSHAAVRSTGLAAAFLRPSFPSDL
ncbi:FecR protein [Pseudobythopirellula maris]|uniref:FecR protein n=1 Tax=Pseudobythopirellula maris TaxID=2527991 RepID=A0A5C5ZH51_9BACT|nr:FecR domain-containing protein [Pseudobythopirellula maris]TWT86654.1 FecR protein [Pseudobythopirellula maris]